MHVFRLHKCRESLPAGRRLQKSSASDIALPSPPQAVFHVLVSTDESETDVILSCLECLSSLVDALLHRCDVLTTPDSRQPATLVRPRCWLTGHAGKAATLVSRPS